MIEGEESVSSSGNEMEPFNLERERGEGLLDEEGTYRTILDPEAREDVWLSEWSDPKQIKAAKEAQLKRQRAVEEQSEVSEEFLWTKLVRLLPPHLTVLQTLQSLRPPMSTKKGLRPSNPHAAQIAEITELCSQLMDRGHVNVYEETVDSISLKEI